MSKRIVATISIPIAAIVSAWLGGFNFERGFALGIGSFYCFLYMAWQWYAPWWGKEKN